MHSHLPENTCRPTCLSWHNGAAITRWLNSTNFRKVRPRAVAGYLGTPAQYVRVWSAFKPGEEVPQVDFDANLVIFTRNIDFYNRINILKITLSNGMADIIAMETRSALPIEDQVAMAMAVIPRAGLRAILAGNTHIEVASHE